MAKGIIKGRKANGRTGHKGKGLKEMDPALNQGDGIIQFPSFQAQQ